MKITNYSPRTYFTKGDFSKLRSIAPRNHGLTAKELWIRTLVVCFSLWLLFGTMVGQASASYLATNSLYLETRNLNASNSSSITGQNLPSQFASESTNYLPSQSSNNNTETNSQSDLVSLDTSKSNLQGSSNSNLLAPGVSSNSTSTNSQDKTCQTSQYSTNNIVSNVDNNSLFGGATSKVLSSNNIGTFAEVEDPVEPCNYSYDSFPHLLAYLYSDISFSQVISIQIDTNDDNADYDRDGHPTIYKGQVYFNTPGIKQYHVEYPYDGAPDIYKVTINNQLIFDRADFTYQRHDYGTPCALGEQSSFNAPTAGWYPISVQIGGDTTSSVCVVQNSLPRIMGNVANLMKPITNTDTVLPPPPVKLKKNSNLNTVSALGPDPLWGYASLEKWGDRFRSGPPITHSFGYENCQVYPHGVTPGTGNFCYSATDLSLPGAVNSSLGLNISRNYNSYDSSSGYFGTGWRSTYDMKVVSDTTASTITVFNPSGRQDAYEFNPYVNYYVAPARANSTLTESPSGYTLVSSDQITYTFNITGSLTQIQDRNSNQVSLNYSGGTLSSVTDNLGHSLAISFTNGFITQVSDGLRSVSYSYTITNSNSYLTGVSDVMGLPSTYAYESSCVMMTKVTDQKGHLVLANTYDTTTNQVTQQDISPADGTTYTANYAYEQATGFQTGKTTYTDMRRNTSTYNTEVSSLMTDQYKDPLGNTTTLGLNNNDLPTTVKNGRSVLSSSSYNNFGLLTSSAVTPTSGVINNQISYNTFNDPTLLTDPRTKQTQVSYTDPSKPSNPQTITDPHSNITSMGYDSQGKVISSTTTGGPLTTYGYNSPSPNQGLPSAITQTLTTLSVSGSGGAPTSGSVSYRTDITYTPQGWVSSQTDPYQVGSAPGGSMSYEYNARGQVLTTTNQLSQHAYNTYDNNGNLTNTKNFLGQEINFTYDNLNRLTTKTQSVAGENLITTYAYDAASNVTSVTSDPGGVIYGYGYDKNNRLITQTTQLKAGGYYQTTYGYDEVGNTTSVVRHNSSGSGGDQTTGYAYDEANRLTTITYVDGMQEKFEYDAAGNITKDSRQIDASSWSDINYNYDDLAPVSWSTRTRVNLSLFKILRRNIP